MKRLNKKKKRITVASAKAKGRKLQKLVCEKISNILGIDWGYEDDKLIQPRIMGQKGVDVVLRGEALEQFPFSVECKAQESWSIHSDIEQAKKNVIKNTDWLLIMKRSHKDPVVIIDIDVFMKIWNLVLKYNK